MNTLTTNLINLDQVEVIESPERELAPSYAGINAENFPASEWRSVNGFLASSPLPHCGRCQDGWLITPRAAQGLAPTSKLCPHCEAPRRALKRIEAARLPYVAHKHTLSTYDWDSPAQHEAVGALLNYIHAPKSTDLPQLPCVLLHGKPGNGKSSMLHILAKHACFSRKRALFITHEGLFADIKASWGRADRPNPVEPETHILNNIDLLCLDELGGIGGSGSDWGDWYRDQTRELIGAIYDRWSAGELAVCMTTNLKPKVILENLLENNSAMRSRMRSMFGRPVEMIGRDRRPQINDGWS